MLDEMMTGLKDNCYWDEHRYNYYVRLRELLLNPPDGFKVHATRATVMNDTSPESLTYEKAECIFASNMLARLKPDSILDVGSYRTFLMGLTAHYKITSLDVRPTEEKSKLDNETLVISDAKDLKIESDSFDAVLSLCSLEHFGLGRYGDEFDLDADKKAMDEMKRVLKPGGHLIFTTTITQAHPVIYFNAHRIYNYKMLSDFCNGLTMVDEAFYRFIVNDMCKKEEIENRDGEFSVYCGCWQK